MKFEAKTIMVLKQILCTLLCENVIRGPQKVSRRETETWKLFCHLNQFTEWPVPGSQIVGKTRKYKAREKLAGRKRVKGRERESVNISFTTLFRPLLARLR